MRIAHFKKDGDHYNGVIRTLSIEAEIRLERLRRKNDAQPEYRILLGDEDIGAIWRKKSKDGTKEYLQAQYDDPCFPNTVYAFFQQFDDGNAVFNWDRLRPKKDA